MKRRTAILLGVGLWLSCGSGEEGPAPLALEAFPIEHHEGAVCGMIVRDQSAPRGQVLHRDGTRSFVCSIGDLLAYLQAPSPHGAAATILVEVMDPDEDPMENHREPHPWVPAAEAVYVVGIPRRGIMGEPVLVYRDWHSAEQVTRGTSAALLDFKELEQRWRDRNNGDRGEGEPR